jgi:hypothetical protein
MAARAGGGHRRKDTGERGRDCARGEGATAEEPAAAGASGVPVGLMIGHGCPPWFPGPMKER